mmetsp:Transcript_21851/g.33860  ORF Transcript_21851/g.33860 Transcript_21851/m.33860 type:complete len:101 (-) Transcript_21851:3320-3622(-)
MEPSPVQLAPRAAKEVPNLPLIAVRELKETPDAHLQTQVEMPEEEDKEDDQQEIDFVELHQQFEQARLQKEQEEAKEMSLIDEICLKESSGRHPSEEGEL